MFINPYSCFIFSLLGFGRVINVDDPAFILTYKSYNTKSFSFRIKRVLFFSVFFRAKTARQRTNVSDMYTLTCPRNTSTYMAPLNSKLEFTKYKQQ
jgi:hypothetical protein